MSKLSLDPRAAIAAGQGENPTVSADHPDCLVPTGGSLETSTPLAWIIARPVGPRLELARRLFGELAALAKAGRPIPPHLTLELVFHPLPDASRLADKIGDVARRTPAFHVSAVGVYYQSGYLTVQLEPTAALLVLRRELAQAVLAIGATPHPGGNWRPHLSAAPISEGSARQANLTTLCEAVAGYRFPVESLVLSLATDKVDVFDEIGPFPLVG